MNGPATGLRVQLVDGNLRLIGTVRTYLDTTRFAACQLAPAELSYAHDPAGLLLAAVDAVEGKLGVDVT